MGRTITGLVAHANGTFIGQSVRRALRGEPNGITELPSKRSILVAAAIAWIGRICDGLADHDSNSRPPRSERLRREADEERHSHRRTNSRHAMLSAVFALTTFVLDLQRRGR
jgi:hypothetical protein